jgi:rubrerythrin
MTIQLTGADLVDLAMETEEQGERFYRAAAEQTSDPEAKEFFAHLADQEIRHKEVFQKLGSRAITTEIDPTSWDEAMAYIEATVDQAFFSKEQAPIRTVPEGATLSQMIRRAIDFEQQTLLYFYTLRDLVHPANRRIVDDIVAEERSHVRRLSAMLAEEEGEA